MIERRGAESWRVQLRIAGVRHRFTVKGTHADAVDFAWSKSQELQKAAERERAGLPGSVRFSALLERFERDDLPTLAKGTREAYVDSFRPIRDYFVEHLGDPVLERIHAKDVKAFLAWRRTARRIRKDRPSEIAPEMTKPQAPLPPLSNRTLEKDRAVLHRLFNFAERLELREGNPVARVPAPKWDPRDPVVLDDAALERLLAECAGRPMLRTYALLLAEAGVRAYSEALHLRWEDVDLREEFLWFSSGRDGHRTKGGRGRWVPMTPQLLEAMKLHAARYGMAMYDGERSAWVFHHETTRRHHRAGARIHDFSGAFDSAVKRAQLPAGFHRHDLRHRRATSWLPAGGDVVKVKEALGHADLRTTMGYTHLAREHLRSLVDVRVPQPARESTAG
jgi:integrase